ncbi:MAG TPA: hypothetical protein VF331_05870 [Polyangiales bacterium]
MIRTRAFKLAPNVARVDRATLVTSDVAPDALGLWSAGVLVGIVSLDRGTGAELARMLGLVEQDGGDHDAR